MTQHDDYLSLIVRAAEDALDADDRARLDGHLSTCADCREALETQIAMRTLLAARPVQQAAPDFARRVRAALPTSQGTWLDGCDFRVWTWRLAPVAALLLVATFSVVRHTATTSTNASAKARSLSGTDTAAGDASVSSALWSSSVSDTSVLSLMIYAQADDPLASHLQDKR